MGFLNWPPTWTMLLLLPALFLSFTVHELSHAVVAYLLGDTSQVERKRLTFNPLRHVSWVGLGLFLLIGIGWAKPVWIDYSRLRIKNQSLGIFLIVIAGAVGNLLLALVVLMGLVVTALIVWAAKGVAPSDVALFLVPTTPGLDMQGLAAALSSYLLNVNLLLAFFNLVPIPPLDGFTALVSLVSLIRGALKGGGSRQSAPQAPATAETGEAALPSPAHIHFTIGLEYHNQGQLDEAVVRYRQAIEQDPHFSLAYYNLGLVYLAKGRTTLAAGAFRSAMQYTTDHRLWKTAETRLREIDVAGQEPEMAPGPVLPPLELGAPVEAPADTPQRLDPAIARQVWLRLAFGGAAFVFLLVTAWLFVTLVTLNGLG